MNQQGTLIVSPSPHVTKKHNTTQTTMMHVLIALLPVTLAAVVIFGYLVAINVFFCVLFCMGLEMLYNMFIKKQWNKEGLKDNSVWDLSPAVTGVILALNLPTHLNIWGLNIVGSPNPATNLATVYFSFDTIIACFIGSFVAIVLVKMLFGGIGKNFANPAAVGRIFLMVAFAAAFNNIYVPNEGLQAVTQVTWLQDKVAGGTNIPLMDMFLGTTGSAAVGETCVIAILLGFGYLCITKVIDFRVPLAVVISTLVFVLFFDGFLKYVVHNASSVEQVANPLNSLKDYGDFLLRHMLSGGLIFGAVFMATDYSSSPKTIWGRIVFAIGIGFFTAVIRTWAMPEGISFAIVIMNILTPLIDKVIKPTPFGVTKQKNQTAKGGSNASPLSKTSAGGAKS